MFWGYRYNARQTGVIDTPFYKVTPVTPFYIPHIGKKVFLQLFFLKYIKKFFIYRVYVGASGVTSKNALKSPI